MLEQQSLLILFVGSVAGYLYGLLLIEIYARVLFTANRFHVSLLSLLRVVALGIIGCMLHSYVKEPILLVTGFIATFLITLMHKAWHE